MSLASSPHDNLLRTDNPEAKLQALESYLKSIISLRMLCKKPTNIKIHDALIKQIKDRISELNKQIQYDKQNQCIVNELS